MLVVTHSYCELVCVSTSINCFTLNPHMFYFSIYYICNFCLRPTKVFCLVRQSQWVLRLAKFFFRLTMKFGQLLVSSALLLKSVLVCSFVCNSRVISTFSHTLLFLDMYTCSHVGVLCVFVQTPVVSSFHCVLVCFVTTHINCSSNILLTTTNLPCTVFFFLVCLG